jgi:rubrerythrin
MHPKAKKKIKEVKAQARRNLEVRKRQQKAMQRMAQDFKDCLNLLVCPRCGGDLKRDAKNWGWLDIINPFKCRYWLFTCYNPKCEFKYKKAPETSIGPM